MITACVWMQVLLARGWFSFDLFGGREPAENFSLLLKDTFSDELGPPVFSRVTSFEEIAWGFPPLVWEFPKVIPPLWSSAGSGAPARLEAWARSFFGRRQPLTWASTFRDKYLYWPLSKAHSWDIKSAPPGLQAWQSAAFTTPRAKQRGFVAQGCRVGDVTSRTSLGSWWDGWEQGCLASAASTRVQRGYPQQGGLSGHVWFHGATGQAELTAASSILENPW